MSDNPNVSQSDLQQAFESYHQMILPYLGSGGSGGTGFTPVGTVIAYYGETAPAHYLICDGTAYNKADYPQLWTHLSSLTDTTPYVVDGDNTKFKVPDLRGEFLRGSGTNSHTDQGSGANVGIHQDATSVPYFGIGTSREATLFGLLKESATTPTDIDGSRVQATYGWTGPQGSTWQCASDDKTNIFTRPTNTSVLFCIAYHDIQIYSVEQPHQYSTEEQVVGTWIDGRPIYEKVFKVYNISARTAKPLDISGIDTIFKVHEYWRYTQSGNIMTTQFWLGSTNFCHINVAINTANNNTPEVYYDSDTSTTYEIVEVLRYTKTTDTPSA